MRRVVQHFLLPLACVSALSFAVGAAPTTIPAGTTPVLDGTLSAEEWTDALLIPLTGQAHILLKHADGFLYIGIQATTMGVGSPLIVRGEEVLVLHSSAALGTAIYTRDGEAWNLTQDFTWQCRSVGFSTPALNQRARFLEQNGWLGTIGYLGDPNQFEYQIAWGDRPMTLLFLYADFTDTMHLLSWPIPPADAAQYATVITGPTPSQICFSLAGWATLVKGE
jgi:hypothetical protein